MADIGRRKGDGALLTALASGQTIRDAAKAAGVGERTATRRLAEPAFRRQVAQLQTEMIQRALGQLSDAASEAVATMRKLLTAKSESVRLAAGRSILELGTRLRDALELEQRLFDLERRIEREHPQATGRNAATFGTNGRR